MRIWPGSPQRHAGGSVGNDVAYVAPMTDRRRQDRAVFAAPVDARVETISDAVVESWQLDRLVVVSARAAAVGDHFVMQTSSRGGVQSWEATVIGCEPIISEFPLRHRLTLSLIPPSSSANGDRTVVM
jgi:hypothetical protein